MTAEISEETRRKMAEGGRKGGLLGGKARVRKGIATLSPERRAEISRKGVEARRKNRNEERD